MHLITSLVFFVKRKIRFVSLIVYVWWDVVVICFFYVICQNNCTHITVFGSARFYKYLNRKSTLFQWQARTWIPHAFLVTKVCWLHHVKSNELFSRGLRMENFHWNIAQGIHMKICTWFNCTDQTSYIGQNPNHPNHPNSYECPLNQTCAFFRNGWIKHVLLTWIWWGIGSHN
jgi:hypothetical protein